MATSTIAPAGPIPADPGQPASSPAQDHVRRLHASGGTYSAIAAAAGLARTTVCDLASGRRPATPYTTTAVLAVTTVATPRTPVDADGTRLRLRALHVMGHGCARIARAVGAHPDTIRALVRGHATTVSPKLRDVIIAVYDAWWDKRATERTRYERGAATTARKRAIAGNWCAAAALDDDQLDTPGYQPQHGWMPATGTGTAPDIRPPAPPRERTSGTPCTPAKTAAVTPSPTWKPDHDPDHQRRDDDQRPDRPHRPALTRPEQLGSVLAARPDPGPQHRYHRDDPGRHHRPS